MSASPPPRGAVRVTLRCIGPEKGEQTVDLREGAVVRDALRAAGIAAEMVLVARAADRQVVPDDEPVTDGEVLLVTRVVTGGAAGAWAARAMASGSRGEATR